MTKLIFILASLMTGLGVFGASSAFAADAKEPADLIKLEKDKCYKELLDKCVASGRAAEAEQNKDIEAAQAKVKGGTNGTNSDAEALKNVTSNAGKGYGKTAATCESLKKDCEKKCGSKDPKDEKAKERIKQCTDDLEHNAKSFQGLGTSMDAASAGSGATGAASAGAPAGDQPTNAAGTTAGDPTAAQKGKGGGMGDMSSMMPMAMMGAMMAMQAGKDDKKDETPTLPPNGALQANGTVDCSKADSGFYSDCNTYLTAACQSAMVSGAYAASPTCTTFATRFCGSGQTDVLTTPFTAPAVAGVAGATTMPTMGLAGEGRSSEFCANAMAFGYCQTPGRTGCPSCQRMGNLASAGCQTNPAVCLQQTSPDLIAQARTTCPDDPIFANPLYATPIATPNPAAGPATGVVGGGATILPQSTGGLQAASADDRVGPASDIAGRYGPSVFSTGSQAIGQLCSAKQLNNCP